MEDDGDGDGVEDGDYLAEMDVDEDMAEGGRV